MNAHPSSFGQPRPGRCFAVCGSFLFLFSFSPLVAWNVWTKFLAGSQHLLMGGYTTSSQEEEEEAFVHASGPLLLLLFLLVVCFLCCCCCCIYALALARSSHLIPYSHGLGPFLLPCCCRSFSFNFISPWPWPLSANCTQLNSTAFNINNRPNRFNNWNLIGQLDKTWIKREVCNTKD